MESRLSSFCAALLLILSISVSLSNAQNSQQTQYTSMEIVGTTNFKGSRLRVFELDGGIQVATPRIAYSGSCSFLRYNRLYLKYQLSLPIQVDTETLTSALGSGKKVGQFSLSKIDVQLNAALASKSSELKVLMTGRPEHWKLSFLCDTFHRCTGLNDELLSNPWSLQQVVKFSLVGRVGNMATKFNAVSVAKPLHLKDCHRGHWFVIQRRVDDNLSFVKGWDDYVKGFGHPGSNFWIGLESLFAMTAMKDFHKTWGHPETAMCRMRMEAEGLDGKKYWSEYGRFQVLGPDQNYRVRVGDEKPGSTIQDYLLHHSESQFSTYDRDNDLNPTLSCSRLFGYGGFWYGGCHTANPNAVMTSRKTDSPYSYQSIRAGNNWVQTKKFMMKLLCE